MKTNIRMCIQYISLLFDCREGKVQGRCFSIGKNLLLNVGIGVCLHLSCVSSHTRDYSEVIDTMGYRDNLRHSFIYTRTPEK